MPHPPLDPAVLARLRTALAGHVAAGRLTGLVTLIARGDEVVVDAYGTGTLGDDRPLGADAVFRVASLTKPVVAVLALGLVDDGVLDLAAPIDDLVPELADRQVLRTITSELDDTVPAERPITLEDVMTFRFGFGNVLGDLEDHPILRAEVDLGLKTLGPPWPPHGLTTDEWLARLGSLPLMEQPGEAWRYNTGSQVLGAVIERVTGQRLGTVLQERLLGPLGMVDTGFTLRPHQQDRMTTAYGPDPDTGGLRVNDPAVGGFWSEEQPFPTASGWLLSTIDDYWSFVRLLLDGGVRDGQRLVSAASLDLLRTDHLTAAQREGGSLFLQGAGWGLGLAVPPADGGPTWLPGYGWDGGSGTSWRTDPATGTTWIYLSQREMNHTGPGDAFIDFWSIAPKV